MGIFTIGHGDAPLETVLELLRRNNITILVDVRKTPYSQETPRFDREQLKASLASLGIRYEFRGDKLGARWTMVLEDEPLFSKALTEMVKYSLRKKVEIALFCTEENPMDCARLSLLTDYFVAHGCPAASIRHSDLLKRPETARKTVLRQPNVTSHVRPSPVVNKPGPKPKTVFAEPIRPTTIKCGKTQRSGSAAIIIGNLNKEYADIRGQDHI